MTEIDYAKEVYKWARAAADETETLEQAVDLLVDAAAMVISEGGGTKEEALERLAEAADTFLQAEEMVQHGTFRKQ